MEDFIPENKNDSNAEDLTNNKKWKDITKRPHFCAAAPSLILGIMLLMLSLVLLVLHFTSNSEKSLKADDPQTIQALSQFLEMKPQVKPLIITQDIELEKIGNLKKETLYFVKFKLEGDVDKLILQVDTSGKLYHWQIGNMSDGTLEKPKSSLAFYKWGATLLFFAAVLIPARALILIKTISFTLQDYTLYEKSGILFRKKKNVNLLKYTDHNSSESLIERPFKCATIVVLSKDEDTPILNIKSIKNAEIFEKDIYDRAMIARARLVRRVDYEN
jgi:hypothetical protein